MTAMTRLTVAQALRRAAARATFAPSLHNSQPWRFILTKGMLELHADRARQLRVLDPDGRQLMISCGCALFNARVALAAAGYATVVRRQPEAGRPDLLARLSIGEADQSPDYRLAALDQVIELRHTNRRRFAEDRVPAELVDDLVAVAAAEGAGLLPIRNEAELVGTAALVRQAIAVADADPAYQAELRAWTTEVPDRAEALAAAGRIEAGQCLLLLWTADDNPRSWLQAGEALQRALLVLTERGYAAGMLSQVAEVPGIRALLSRQLELTGEPHLLLRVGRAPMTPASRRRRLAEVLVEHL
jgi:Nitroreductase family